MTHMRMIVEPPRDRVFLAPPSRINSFAIQDNAGTG